MTRPSSTRRSVRVWPLLALGAAVAAVVTSSFVWPVWAYAVGVLFAVLWSAAGAALILVQKKLRERARRRGYRGPFLPSATALILFVGWLAGGLTLDRLEASPGEATLDEVLAFAPWFVGSVLVAGAAAAGLATALVMLLPRREARVAGARHARFPWRGFAVALLLAGVMLAITGLVQGQPLIDVLRFAFFGWAGAAMAWAYAQRAGARALEAVAAEDPRAPVLYLRSFANENEPFVRLPAERRYLRYFVVENDVPEYLPDEEHRPTFEQFFRAAVEERIGPLVALGNPEDYLPPLGGAREYVPDDRWQAEFRRLATSATCCLAAADHTPNLEWEFTALREAALQGKLFVLTPPGEACDWAAVAEVLTAAGYTVESRNPGPGAVVGFEASGRTVVIARRATTASDYVAAIAAALEQGRVAELATAHS